MNAENDNALIFIQDESSSLKKKPRRKKKFNCEKPTEAGPIKLLFLGFKKKPEDLKRDRGY